MKLAAALALAWALVALIGQVLLARGRGRTDYSARAGSPGRGVLHAFTVAMLPAHKESVRHHPGKFAVGVLLHVGVVAALVEIVARIAGVSAAPVVTAVCALAALPAALFLLVRRVVSPVLRAMSAPDDFVSILAVAALLALAALHGFGATDPAVLLAYAIPFLVYLPLGKLRHSIFFFVSRADFGRRLGYRGSMPLAAAPVNQPHAGRE